ncbi:MAG: carbohydrate ABC transporter permease [Proteobacteria bacterium]|nr:carbohydrate ABC transporter permease [Pseudomonadota bacterium]
MQHSSALRTTRWVYLPLVLVTIASLAPFIWMILTAVKDYGDVISLRFWPWPPLGDSRPNFGNFAEAIQLIGVDADTGMPLFVRHFLNTLAMSIVVVVATLSTSVLAAYAFAQLNFPAKRLLFLLVLATYMAPEELMLVPRAVMMNKAYLNLYDTFAAMVAPFLASAFGIFLIRQFFLQVPRDLFDAARIDGAGHMSYCSNSSGHGTNSAGYS